jgi:hypothetical protein
MPDTADTEVTPVPDPRLKVYWPISARFREEIANRESRGSGGYRAINDQGALGAYQLTPIALKDIHWKDKNGNWTDASGVTGDEANYSALKLRTRDELRQRRWCEAGSGS